MADGVQRRGLFGAAAVLTAASAVTLLVNLFIQRQIAGYFGAGAHVDAYRAAMAIPQVLQAVLGVALTFVLVPFFVGAFRRDEASGWRAASVVVNVALLATAAAAVAAFVAGDALIRATAAGLPPAPHDLAVRLFHVSLPAGFLLMLQSVLTNVCYARFKFLRPTAAVLANGLFVIAFLAVFHGRLGIMALPLGNLGGTAVSVVVMGGVLAGRGRYRPTLAARGTGLGAALVTGLPLIITAVVYQSEAVIRTRLASYMPEGSLAVLGYATTLLAALQQATATGLSDALFPFLSRVADDPDRQVIKDRFNFALIAMLYLVLPVAALALTLAEPAVRGIFEVGRFRAADTHAVTRLLWLFLPAYAAMCLGMVTSNLIFALKRTAEASGAFLVAWGTFVVALLLLVPHYGIGGIAIATSIHYALRLALSWGLLRRRLGPLGGGRVLVAGAGFVAAAAAAGAAAYALRQLLAPHLADGLLTAVLAAPAALAVYLAVTLFLIRSPISDFLRRHLMRRKGRSV